MKKTVALLALMTLAGTAMAAPRESRNAPASVDVLPYPDQGSFTLSFTGSDGGGAYIASNVHVVGTMTAVADATYALDTILTITAPGGLPVSYRLSQTDIYVTEPVDNMLPTNGAVNPAGNWLFECTDDFQDGDGTAESTLDGLVLTLDDTPVVPPTASSLGTLVDGTPTTADVTLAAAEVQWFTVTVAAANANRSLDINTIGSTGDGDSEIGVYGSTGTLYGFNDDEPSGDTLFSQLTFGNGGNDGNLPAGTYFIALGTYNTDFLPNFSAVSDGDGGDFHLSILQTVVTVPADVWDEGVNGGGDAGQTLATAQTVGGTGTLTAITGAFGVNDVDMYKINICDTAAFSASTAASPGAPDTEMFLFRLDGTGVVMNDDSSGPVRWSQIDASSGAVTATGNYYLAVSRYDQDPTSGGVEIWLDEPFAAQRIPDGAASSGAVDGWNGANGTTASYRIDLAGVCRATAGPVCGAADVGGTGGVAGADGHLDNNDFVVFIDFFFNHNPLADQGSIGGTPGADGLWDNNDFVVFIDNFFNAPASCR
jgi:hypothetical protein